MFLSLSFLFLPAPGSYSPPPEHCLLYGVPHGHATLLHFRPLHPPMEKHPFLGNALEVDYMGLNWATPEDVLEYLQQNQSARRLLRKISEDILLTGWDTTYIVHPLLNPPLRLDIYLSDDEFVDLINDRLATEQRVRAG
ncbi:hypothetical protein BJ322DRAFT_1022408 [Thelephora terrestris]|uniref:Uncharacterized protein n=1 Tax=Thelephora terrestris TaxID=56493 RepID=A0A9P6HB14_9AGAM|nr:hypothetical protein BJ322DRAFT_1022408 [Thelephora terrestris]